MSQVLDLTGRTFGHLRVEHRAGSNHNGRALWLCVCDCGRSRKVAGNELAQGRAKACGYCPRVGEFVRCSPETEQKIKSLAGSGHSVYAIARRLNIHRSTVRRVAPYIEARSKPVKSIMFRIYRWRQNGMTWKQIATEHQSELCAAFRRDAVNWRQTCNYFGHHAKRLYALMQAKGDVAYDWIGNVQTSEQSAREIAEENAITERHAVRLRSHGSKKAARHVESSTLPYDFGTVRELFMERELTWPEIRKRLHTSMTSAELEKRFHAEADRRSGVTRI